MEYRRLGKTGRDVSVIGFGAWAIGADWGAVDDADSLRALHAAADAGVNLIDTADVYGDGRSERVIRRFLAERAGETFFVATKMGRRAPLDMASYTPEAFRAWTDRSRENLGVETLDLVQLHCLHPSIYYSPEHFAALDELVAAGAIAAYGVSVEKVEEALKAIEFPGVATVQIIFNMFRQRPADRFLAEAARRDVGVLARVPLASGLLTGKLTAATTFEADGPSPVQPPRRVLRRGRDVRRRGLRDGPRGGRGAQDAGPGGRHPGPGGPALDPDARRDHDGDPGRQDPRAGTGQRRRGGPGAAPARDHGPRRGALRDPDQAPGPPALVGAPGPSSSGAVPAAWSSSAWIRPRSSRATTGLATCPLHPASRARSTSCCIASALSARIGRALRGGVGAQAAGKVEAVLRAQAHVEQDEGRRVRPRSDSRASARWVAVRTR